MNFLDENFGHSFVCLDFITNRISNLSLKSKIKILEITRKAIDDQLKSYNQDLKFRENLYKLHIS